jgi:hypothetical protein
MKNLSGNGVSKVWIEGNYVYKEQPKFLTDNEWYALDVMRSSNMVPYAWRHGLEVIKMMLLKPDPHPPPNPLHWYDVILSTLRSRELRHGDLTRPHLIFQEGNPYIIDWGESRYLYDPRPDKRPEGDEYWLMETLKTYGRS